MERTTSALEAARKELHRKKPSKITLYASSSPTS